ncbi:hypothetical protein ABID42_000641 [Arcicella rosea]|uniref:DUF3078 domain-containing protein n=1 Tax=Arcicella rosea TaxID=502909 RepID=UPI00345DE414
MKKQHFLFFIVSLFYSSNIFAQEVKSQEVKPQEVKTPEVKPQETKPQEVKPKEIKKDTSYWKKKTQYGANFSNADFSNWSPGGQNATGFTVFFNTKREYAKAKTTWVNDLQMQYGLLNNGNGFRKSIDRLFFDSKVGHKISPTWALVGVFNFQSQFTSGYKYGDVAANDIKISNFLSPAYITESIGFEWRPKPFFSMVASPGAIRQTIVTDNGVREKDPITGELKPAYGVRVGSKFRNDFALIQIVSNFDKDIAKNVNLKLRHQVFINANSLGHIDNRIDAKVAAKINKYFSATFDFILLYDDDLSTKIQQARNLGLGFLHTF